MVEIHNPFAGRSDDWREGYEAGIAAFKSELITLRERGLTAGEDHSYFVDCVIRDVAELPDRTSPPEQPDLMLVTEGELRDILWRRLEARPEPFAEPAPTTGEGWQPIDDAIGECRAAVVQCYYGSPSSRGGRNPDNWHLPEDCTPTDAAMHDNGINDAMMAIGRVRDRLRVAHLTKRND